MTKNEKKEIEEVIQWYAIILLLLSFMAAKKNGYIGTMSEWEHTTGLTYTILREKIMEIVKKTVIEGENMKEVIIQKILESEILESIITKISQKEKWYDEDQ